jgi:CheY-like chemotaxis protein
MDILVVEDNADIRDALAEILSEEGYELATAGNGLEALAHIEESGLPKLIILDLMMPVMDGWTFRRELLRRPEGDQVPIIVFSGFTSPSGAEMVGRVQYVAKPVKIETLLVLVARELSSPQNQKPRTLAAGAV